MTLPSPRPGLDPGPLGQSRAEAPDQVRGGGCLIEAKRRYLEGKG